MCCPHCDRGAAADGYTARGALLGATLAVDVVAWAAAPRAMDGEAIDLLREALAHPRAQGWLARTSIEAVMKGRERLLAAEAARQVQDWGEPTWA